MKYDVIIIGSGLGGLECAHILSKAGKSVLVIERQAQPGGCMQSYSRGGHAFDTGLHYVGGLGEGQSLYNTFEKFGLLDLPWQHLDADGFDHVTIGDRTFRIAEGKEAFVDTLAADFPHERQALNQYYTDLATTPYDLMMKGAWDYLNERFSDPLLVNVISGNSVRMELNKETLSFFAFSHSNYGFMQSSWRLKGDGNMLVDKLIEGIRAQGGEVVCNTEVEALEAENGTVVAARCNNGERYEANSFISDAHPAVTCQWVKMKPLYRRRITEQPNTFGLFTVSLLLKPHSLRYFNHNHYVYSQPNVWTFYKETGPVGGVMVCCRPPENPYDDYTRQVDILTPMLWEQCQAWADTKVGHRGDAYKELKTRLAHECIALTERVLPGLSSMIEACHTSTPLTYRDYTLTPQGSAYGIRKDYHYPLFTIISPRTPLSNLLLTGQSLMLHGVHGVTMTALYTCSELLGTDYIQTHYKENINMFRYV